MALNYDFEKCTADGFFCKDSVWEHQFNTNLISEGLEPWYQDISDFSRNDTAPSVSVNATEVLNDGDPRVKQKVDSFEETQTFAVNEDCNSSFLQRWHEIWAFGTDSQRRDFLDYGMNTRKYTYFGNGSYTIEEWLCNGFKSYEPAFRKQIPEDEAATVEFELLFANEPTVTNVAFTPELPSTVVSPTATTSITTTSPLTIDFTLADILDPDNLIFNDTFATFVYDENGQLVSSNEYISTDFPVTEIVTQAGNYVVALAYKLFDDGTDKIYKNLEVVELTIEGNEAPIITVGTSPISYTTLDNGSITFANVVTDASITAIDSEDGDITADIVFNGSNTSTDLVDLSTVGNFNITLDVTDSNGAVATQENVTINVT